MLLKFCICSTSFIGEYAFYVPTLNFILLKVGDRHFFEIDLDILESPLAEEHLEISSSL